MNSKFAQRLKELRKEQKKTQDDIANCLKVRRSTYGEYERGKITPTADKLLTLAALFNVSVEYLAGISDTPRPMMDTTKNVKHHLELFISWLQDDSIQRNFDGVELSKKESLILATALRNVKQLGQTIIERGNNE